MQQPGGMHRVPRRSVVLTALALIGGVAAGALVSVLLHVARSSPPASSQTHVLVAQPLARQPSPPFTLTDQNGTPVSLAAQKGHVVLLTFMDPLCTTLCPVMGRDIGALERALPRNVNVELLIVSVAPGRIRADVQHYVDVQHPGWTAPWHWLLGPSAAALKLTWLHWHILVLPTPGDVTHDEELLIIDPQGYLRATFPAPLAVSDAAHDIVKVSQA